MKIGDRKLNIGDKPYIVAELSGEHKQNWGNMQQLMKAAKDAGADAIKIQIFEPAKLAEDRGGKNKVCMSGPWKGITLGQLYSETFTPFIWHRDIIDYAHKLNIGWFASVFDVETVEYAYDLDCPIFKIAAQEHMFAPLIQACANTGKPIIVSLPVAGLGIAANKNVEYVIDYLKKVKTIIRSVTDPVDKLAFLHCTDLYPCPFEHAHMIALRNYLSLIPQIVMGLSDHTLGITAPIMAAAYGAPIIEKHLTLSREHGGWDRSFSLEPHEFKQMVTEVNNTWVALVGKETTT